MSWEIRAQFSKSREESPGEELEWSAIYVDTQEEAESWWNCRVSLRGSVNVVHTMYNPQGELVRVLFK